MELIIKIILELKKLKAVTRKTRPLNLERYENSAEHSWQLCLKAISLSVYAERQGKRSGCLSAKKAL
jgi:putative hydrolase of HD superfamily